MGTDIEINDHTDDFTDEFYAAVFRGLEKIGITAEAYAKLLCPVDTGRLRNSITHAISGENAAISEYRSNNVHADTPATRKNGTAGKTAPVVTGSYSGVAPAGEKSVFIGTNVEYAAYVEMGTSRTDPQPFLQPAIENHKDEYIRLLMDEL